MKLTHPRKYAFTFVSNKNHRFRTESHHKKLCLPRKDIKTLDPTCARTIRVQREKRQ
jgi:hypothetical protein